MTPKGLAEDWAALVSHVHQNQSDLVLLPEMPFARWVMLDNQVSPLRWLEFVKQHDEWMQHLPQLSPAAVFSTRPVIQNGRWFNEAFLWDEEAVTAPFTIKLTFQTNPVFGKPPGTTAGLSSSSLPTPASGRRDF